MRMQRSICAAVLALAAVVLSPVFSDASRGADGYWELYRVEMDRSKPDRDNVEIAANNQGGALVVRVTFKDRNTGKVIDDWIGSFGWSAMPRTILPGNKVKVDVTQAITYKPKVDVGYHPSIVSMRIQPYVNGKWGEGGAPRSADGKVALETHSRVPDPKPTKYSPVFELKPGLKPGDLVGPAVWVWHGSQTPWRFRYVYIWRQGSPPANPGPPMPPAQTWDGKSPIPSVDSPTTPPSEKSTIVPKTTDPTPPSNKPGPDVPGPSTVKPPVGIPSVPGTGMVLVADKRQVKTGGEVWLPIWLLRARDVGNMNFEVTYDASVVQPIGQPVKGNLLGGALFEANPAQSGKVLVGFAANQGISGNGTVTQIRFRAVGKPGTSTPIGLRITTVNSSSGSRLTVDTVTGQITVLTADERVPGDATGDGILDLADVLSALKMSVKLIPEDLICDVDESGSVTSNDARILFQKVSQR